MITIYIPSYTRHGTDDRRGDGQVIRDSKGNNLVIDGFDGSEPTTKLIAYLKRYNLKSVNLLLTHAHNDHYVGIKKILADSYFAVKTLYTYDPATLKLAGDGTRNGKAAASDKAALTAIISTAKSKGAKVVYLKTGDTITHGDIKCKVWRKQPTSWGEYEYNEAWQYLNDGSICTYFPDIYYITTGDGPNAIKDAVQYFGGRVAVFKIPHHGNSCSQSNAQAMVKAGAKLCFETNVEQKGPGTTSYTAYGAKRCKEAGLVTLMLDSDITMQAESGKLVVKQGSKSWTYSVPYIGDLYYVRKSFTDEKTEYCRRRVYSNAVKECKAAGAGYHVFDRAGKVLYSAPKSDGTVPPAINANKGFRGYNVSKRTEKIQYIVMHYTGSEGTAANNVTYFNGGDRQASADFFVGLQGEVYQYNPDILNQYTWHCGGGRQSSKGGTFLGKCTNRNSIGIEMCTTKTGGAWQLKEATLNSAAQLVKYLMQLYGIPLDHVIRHFDVTGKNCPGVYGWGYTGGDSAWLAWKKRLGDPVLTDDEKFIQTVGALAKSDMAKSGVLASITIAQAILESAWGKSDLAVKAFNLFGMKCSLSGNTWPGSTWDGKSAYNKQTGEYYGGSYKTVSADFRKYKSWAESVGDHSAYLTGAKSGNKLRYDGIKGCTDYRKAAQIIKDGGYATSPTYVTNLCNLIEKYNLTAYDGKVSEKTDTTTPSKVPYTVKVPATKPIYDAPNGKKVKDCPVGVYTIVEEKNGYGRLKSGAGWIKL